MPLLLLPLIAGGVGFGAGWFTNEKYGWMKWVIIAALAYLYMKNKKMI
ncbi:hypothetical protein [Marinomonas algicola]|nr:hypothetical protein [Marinomonas algicola]